APAAEAPAPEAAPAPFALESPPPEKTSTDCRHALVEGSPYEKTFAATKRTLVAWRAIGAAATPRDMPPFDSPWLMAAWYRRHKQRRVPARLLDLEAAGPSAASASLAPQPSSHPAPTPAPAGASAAPANNLALGYAATLQRFQQAEAV